MALQKYLAALRNLIIWPATILALVPAVLACLPAGIMLCDMVNQLRLQNLYCCSLALVVMLALRSWRDHPRLLALVVLALFSHAGDVALAYGRSFTAARMPAAQASGKAIESALTVLDSNLQLGNKQFNLFKSVVASTNPDVICLQELSHDWEGTLAGLRSVYPYQALYPRSDFGGMGMLSRYPIVAHETIKAQSDSIPIIVSHIAVPTASGGSKMWTVNCIHTAAPLKPANFARRNNEIAAMAKIGRSQVGGEQSGPVLCCGDFNCVPWSRHFQALESESGLSNSVRGRLPELSWSSVLPQFLRIPIDHILVSPDVRTVRHEMAGDVGSDHYPIVVRAISN